MKKNTKLKVMILGGCGFVGTNIFLSLNKDFEIYLVDNFYKKTSKKNYNFLKKNFKNLKFSNINLLNFNKINNFIKKVKPEIMIFLAGQVSMIDSIHDPINDLKLNTLTLLNVLDSYKDLKIKEKFIIYASSNKVYGDLNKITYAVKGNRYIPKSMEKSFNEDLSVDLKTPYGCSKGTSENYLFEYSRLTDIKYIIARHSSIYGNYQNSTINQGWVSWFINEYEIQKKQNT